MVSSKSSNSFFEGHVLSQWQLGQHLCHEQVGVKGNGQSTHFACEWRAADTATASIGTSGCKGGPPQAFSCHTTQGAKGSRSSQFKRGTAGTVEREPASHLCRRHHLSNFSSLFIVSSLIKKHSYTAYHSLFSLIILLGNNTNHSNLAERHMTCQQHLLPLIPPSAVVLPLQPKSSSSAVVCMHWIQEGFTTFKNIYKLSVKCICTMCLPNMKHS